MPDKPTAEVTIDEQLVRNLLLSQAAGLFPDAANIAVAKVAEGWDSEVWQVGSAFAARLPRRKIAAPLVLNEQRVLPGIAARLESTGLRVPAPILDGVPEADYPWPWSIVPWIEGTRGIDVPREDRSGWAGVLGLALTALHTTAPADFPINPFRGVPLVERSISVADRLAVLQANGVLSSSAADAAASVWADGLDAAPWAGPPLWIHGDLHPANLIARGTRLVGIIDFGDVTAGDPAYDLAVAWLAFDVDGRSEFRASSGGRYDDDTWARARAWGASVALMLLAHSDDEPAFARLGREALDEVTTRSR